MSPHGEGAAVKSVRMRAIALSLLAGLLAAITYAAPASAGTGVAPAGAAPAAAGPYSMFFLHSDKCVTVPGASGQWGVQLDQWECISTTTFNQRWFFEFTTDGYAKIRNQNSGLCINVSGGSTANGAAIIQWGCNFWSGNDEWKGTLVYTDQFGIDYYQLKARHSGKCLVVQNASTAQGARLVQWTCTLGDANNDVLTWQNQFCCEVPSARREVTAG